MNHRRGSFIRQFKVRGVALPAISPGWLCGGWLGLTAVLVILALLTPHPTTIHWQTASELDSAGFYLYRQENEAVSPIQLTQQLIPSQGSSTAGAAYSWVDARPPKGQTVHYWLQEIELDGTAVAPILIATLTIPRVNRWLLLLALFCLVQAGWLARPAARKKGERKRVRDQLHPHHQ